MATSVQMPALGESVTEGTVTRWLKQEGDTVELDEPLLEVSTDKVDTEIPSPAAGVLTKIIAQEDDTVEVGGDLAVIGDAGEDAGGGDGEAQAAEEEKPAEEPAAEEPEAGRAEPEEKPEPEEAPEPEEKPAAKPSGGEATPVLMPELGESVTEGTVTRWLKKVGDSVEVDEPLVEVSTDKVDTEIPSPVAGTLVSITAEEDDTVAVGGELAKIGDGRRRARRRGAGAQARTQARTETGAQGRAEAAARRGSQARTEAAADCRSQARARTRSRSRSRKPPRSRPATALRT